ncbi:MAG: hypothetical protein GX948_05390 [Clostridiaceae bacterium]|jgi:hypothetical protein|nr:KOW domain-containing RNA-binding protein [Clostridia bacterium]MBP6161772.1 KOW domain-containing RNA-binding protein [Clostridia bacterium]MBP6949977.1 KOW domain-containing RNA-binding protein [Clostridia bacterium]NMA36267.1 hypothetical protein [Clostridiaceae bacterium]
MGECDRIEERQLSAKFVPGMIVRSRSGHDRGRLYVVIGSEKENYLLLSDGNKRTLVNAKRKNVKHVQAVGKAISSQELADALRRETCERERDTFIRHVIRAWEETCATGIQK